MNEKDLIDKFYQNIHEPVNAKCHRDLQQFDMRGSIIPAVKHLKDNYNLSLKEAVNIVREYRFETTGLTSSET